MSDNPSAGGEDLLRLGVDVDSGSFAALNAAVDALNARIDELISNVAQIALTGDESAGKLLNSLQSIGQVSAESGANIDALRKQVDELDAEYRQLGQTVNQTSDALSAASGSGYSINQMAAGYGVKGGMVGPAESGGIETGSLFGVAHAASVAGHATGIGGLREVGALLYIEEGLKRVGPLFEQLDASLQASGGLIPPLTEGLSGLGIPMAGLLATAIPLGVAVGAAAIATGEFIKQLDEIAKITHTATDEQVKYHEWAAEHTSKDAEERIKHDKNVQASNEKTIANTQAKIAEKLREAGYSKEDIKTSFEKNEPPPGLQFDYYAVVQPLYEDLKKLKEASGSAADDINNLTNGIKNGDFAAQDHAEATKKAMKAEEEEVAFSLHAAELKRNGTVKQVQSEIDQLNDKITGNEVLIALNQARDQSEAGVKERTAELTAENVKYQSHIDALKGAVMAAVKDLDDGRAGLEAFHRSLESIASAAKEAVKQAERITGARADLQKAEADAQTQLENQSANAKLRESQAEEQYHRGSLQDIYERTRIGIEEGRKELEAAQANAEKIQDINLKLYEKQYDIGLDYSRQVQDDQTKLGQKLGQIAREGQSQAQEDAIDHQAKMAQLRERDIVADTQSLLDRNFKALYLAGLHKEQEARKEETDFAAKEARQQRQLQRQAQEAVIAEQQEQQQQQVGYLRKMADAQRNAANEIVQADIAEQRKLQTLRLAEQQKLTDLTTSENYKIRVLRQGLQNEIALDQQQSRQRIEIARQTQAAIINDALAQIARITQQNTAINTGLGIAGGVFGALKQLRIFDSGGSFGAGEPFMKGNISEDFAFGGGQVFNMGGSALVMPLRGGTATPQGSSSQKNITLAPTFNIYEATDIRRIKGQLLDMLDEVQN